MAETSLELSYPISLAELIYPFNNIPISNGLCYCPETDYDPIHPETIYCSYYKNTEGSAYNIRIVPTEDSQQSYSNSPANDASDSLPKSGNPSSKPENQSSPNFLTSEINGLINYIQSTDFESLLSSETLAVTMGIGSIGIGMYLSKTGIYYLAAGTSIGAIALIASLYFESPFINNLGIEVIKYSAMKFFCSSIEGTLIAEGSRIIPLLGTIAASGITTTWVYFNKEIVSYTNSNITVDTIPYNELLPAVFIKRATQGIVEYYVPVISKSLPYISEYVNEGSKTFKITSDFLGLFIGGTIKDTIYVYREVKNYTFVEILGRELFSASFKTLPGVTLFDKYGAPGDDKNVVQFSLEWMTTAVSRNLGKISFEYFYTKPLNATPLNSTMANPKIAQSSKNQICSPYPWILSEDDNDSYPDKI